MKRYEKWQLILLALYAEVIRCGSFAEVTASVMDMGRGEFGWTMYQLQMRGHISGCVFQPPHPGAPGNLMGMIRDDLLLTPQGFQAAEAMVNRDTDAGRLHAAWEIMRDVGCSVMASVIYGWLN